MRPSISTIGTLGSMGIQEKASIQIKNILDGVDDDDGSDDDDDEDSNGSD